MKWFLYIDTDKINSIIAQANKGRVDNLTTENGNELGETHTKKLSGQLEGEIGGSLWKLAKAEASLNGEIGVEKVKNQNTTTKEIIAKTLHDAAFDIAYEVIKPKVMKCGEDDTDYGEYVEIARVFDFVDFDYLEGLFVEKGIIDLLKKTEKEAIEQ